MKKVMTVFLLVSMLAILNGCNSTCVKVYDPVTKNLLSETTTSSDIAGTISANLKDKMVFIWETGWVAYASISMSTTDDPTPTGKFWAGNVNKGYFSAPKDMDFSKFKFDEFAKAVRSTNKDLSVGKDGIGSSSTAVDAPIKPIETPKVPEVAK